MEALSDDQNRHFSNYLKNQKIKENFKDIKFNEFVDILFHIDNTNSELKQIRNINKNYLEKANNPIIQEHQNIESNLKFKNEIDQTKELDHELPPPEKIEKSKKAYFNNTDIDSKTQDYNSDEELQKIFNDENFQSQLLIEESIRKDNENKTFFEIKTKSDLENNVNMINKKERKMSNLLYSLKINNFNVQGLIIKVYPSMTGGDSTNNSFGNKSNIIYQLQIHIKDIVYKNDYNIFLFNVHHDNFDRIQSLQINSVIYILNLRAAFTDKGEFFLHQTTSTKISLSILKELDFYNPCILNDVQKSLVLGEDIKKINDSKDSSEQGRLYVPSMGFYPRQLRGNKAIKEDLEFVDLIDANLIDEILRKIPNEMKDVPSLLVKEVDNCFFTASNALSINKGIKSVDICGMILSHKIEEKLTTIELISLKDSNVIKIIHFSKIFSIDLKENMIVVLHNALWKINKNFDLILEIQNDKNLNILGTLSNEESSKIKKFRFNKNKDYDTVLSLLSNKIIRSIQKVNIRNFLIKGLLYSAR